MLRPIRPGNWLSVALASANTSAAAASASGTPARVLDASWLARPFVGCEERPRMKEGKKARNWKKERQKLNGAIAMQVLHGRSRKEGMGYHRIEMDIVRRSHKRKQTLGCMQTHRDN